MKTAIFLFCFLALPAFAITECTIPPDGRVSFYISAHQDDWQLFMGSDAFRDIAETDRKASERQKVVIIYTTAGNLNDTDDTKTCDCGNVNEPHGKRMAYWEVREIGARNSVHFAANVPGEYGPRKYPDVKTGVINGHQIARYEFKNTVSYFMRIKDGMFSCWYDNEACKIGTVDNSTYYANRTDFEQTLAAIFTTEMEPVCDVSFHIPDTDEQINPNDHHDHIITGRAAIQAVKSLAQQSGSVFPVSLYVDYHTKNLAANITGADAQNEAALTAAYSMALLNYNAWPEWGSDYQTFTCRNYYRTLQIGAE